MRLRNWNIIKHCWLKRESWQTVLSLLFSFRKSQYLHFVNFCIFFQPGYYFFFDCFSDWMFREKTCSTARAVCKQNERKKKTYEKTYFKLAFGYFLSVSRGRCLLYVIREHSISFVTRWRCVELSIENTVYCLPLDAAVYQLF